MNINKFSGDRYLGVKNGFALDGVDDYIVFPFNRMENEGSISIHFKLNSYDTPPTASQIFQYVEGGNDRISIEALNSPGSEKKLFVSLTKGSTISHTNDYLLEVGNWYHLVVNYSASTFQVFINGERIHSQTGSYTWTYNTIIGTSDTRVQLGVSNGLVYKTDMDFGHVSLFNRTLGQDEVIYIHRYFGIIPPSSYDDCLFHWTAQYDTVHKGFAQGKNASAKVVIVNQPGHGLTVGQAIRFDGVNWVAADGTVEANWSNPPTVVFLAGVDDFRAYQDGIAIIPTTSMGEPGDLVYAQSDGSITSSRTDNLIGKIISATELMIYKEREYYTATSTKQYNLTKTAGLSEDYGVIYGKTDADLGIYSQFYATEYSDSYIDLKGEAKLAVSGNAKVYDGSFDYDNVIGWAQLERTATWSINLQFYSNVNTTTFLVVQGDVNTARGIHLFFSSSTFTIDIRNSNSNRILKTFNIVTPISYNSWQISYDGSSDASGLKMYKNGIELAATTTTNTLTQTIISPSANLKLFNRPLNTTQRLNGKAKQVEWLNRVATPAEMLLTHETGSFRGAGIAYNSGEYLLAVDFDKTDGEVPTTFPDTPSYTITSFGGTEYTYYNPEPESNYTHIKEGLKLTSTEAGYSANTYIDLDKSNLPNENTDDYTFVWQGYVNLKDFAALPAGSYVREHLFLLSTMNTGVWNTSNRVQFAVQYQNDPAPAYPLPAIFLGRAGTGGFSDAIIDDAEVRGVFSAPLTMAVTYNSATNTWSYYMNGLLIDTGVNTSTKQDFDVPATIFRLNNTLPGSGVSSFYSGHEIFGFGYWKRELHISEIIHLHNNGLWNNPWTQLPVYHKRYMQDDLVQWLNFSETNIYDDGGTLKIVNQADNFGLTDAVLVGYPNLASAHNAVYYKQELQ